MEAVGVDLTHLLFPRVVTEGCGTGGNGTGRRTGIREGDDLVTRIIAIGEHAYPTLHAHSVAIAIVEEGERRSPWMRRRT